MTPPTPRSTLFPYTTLFRSRDQRGRLSGAHRRIEGQPGRPDPGHALAAGEAGVCHQFFGDRKSTRLNSSHSQISYAVFCLKKKKKKEVHIIDIECMCQIRKC